MKLSSNIMKLSSNVNYAADIDISYVEKKCLAYVITITWSGYGQNQLAVIHLWGGFLIEKSKENSSSNQKCTVDRSRIMFQALRCSVYKWYNLRCTQDKFTVKFFSIFCISFNKARSVVQEYNLSDSQNIFFVEIFEKYWGGLKNPKTARAGLFPY